jgi:WD40 repeat protein
VLGRVPRDPMAVRWSPDGRWIAAIDEGGTTVVWRASDGAEVRRLAGRPPPSGGGVDVAFSPDGRWLFASRAGPRVLLALDGGQDLALEGTDDTLNWAVAFSPDGARVASNDERGDVQVWSTRTGKVEHRFGAPAMSPSMRFSRDGKLLVAGGVDHVVRVWDLGRGALLSTYDAVDEVYSLEWSPDGERLALTTLAAAATWRPRR